MTSNLRYLKGSPPEDGCPVIKLSHKDSPVIRPYLQDLHLCYLVDNEGFYDYIQNHYLEEDGISMTFEFGRRFERQGRIYREFLCRSGSVHLRICIYAGKNNLARGIIMRGTKENAPYCTEIRAGVEIQFNCDELNPVPLP